MKQLKLGVIQKYYGYQKGFASMVYKFFDKKSSRSGVDNKSKFHWQMNLISRSLKHLREEKFIHRLETIFGVLI